MPMAQPAATAFLRPVAIHIDLYSDEDEFIDQYLYGYFELSVEITTAGVAVNGAETSLSVTDEDLDYNLIPLFTSTNLTGFGSGAEDLFEFTFTHEGAGLPDPGDQIGVILSGWSIDEFNDPNDPVFNIDFDNNYNGVSNTFYMPEPTSIALLSVAGIGAVLRKRKRR